MKINRQDAVDNRQGAKNAKKSFFLFPTCRPLRLGGLNSGFTMVEIAICLAIIGIALVAIIGILPLGIDVQKDNREETIINQDATVFIEAIRNGARGADDLTNYVYAITNYWGHYDLSGALLLSGSNGYTYAGYSIVPPSSYAWSSGSPINNCSNIIGLLSTPEYIAGDGTPHNNLFGGDYSNHIVAYVRSISGPAVEKPPQDNPIVTVDSFSYKIICENVPVAVDTNAPSPYTTNLTANLHELRLTFQWPLLPNGKVGSGHQTFRTTIAGQLVQDAFNTDLYFYQSQSFTNAP